MYLFRGDAPLQEFGATLPAPVRLGFRFLGHRFLRSYPYEEAFFLPYARQFQRALSTPLILLGGITELATIETALAEGFAFVAMARALLREPDLPNRMQAGTSATSLCIHCNKCMPTIYSGTRCVLVADRPVPPRKLVAPGCDAVISASCTAISPAPRRRPRLSNKRSFRLLLRLVIPGSVGSADISCVERAVGGSGGGGETRYGVFSTGGGAWTIG